MHDLAEHAGTLLSIIGSLVAVAGFLIWNKLNSIEKKVDNTCLMHFKCREELPEKFITKEDFGDWKKGRCMLWNAIVQHEHAQDGRTIVVDGRIRENIR